MPSKRPPTIQDQTLHALREGLRSRRWAGVLPGTRQLAKELGVSKGTLQTALKRLEAEGLLSGKGARAPREVAPAAAAPTSARTLRVGILLSEPVFAESTLNQVLLHGVAHALEESGHRPFFSPKTMLALRHDPESIRMMMTDCAADAWVILNARRPLLESLATDFPAPIMTVGGPADGLNIAKVGISMRKVTRESVRRLVALGHRRIVMAVPLQKRNPRPSPSVSTFIEELAAAGIKPGPYHLPDWDQSREGFKELLRSLFALTPPTALIVDDVRQLCAVYAFLSERRIPLRDLAIVLLAADPALDWVSPVPTCIRYDNDGMIDRVASWVATLAAGGSDTSQVYCEAKLAGGEFNPPPRT
jgi:DNA-binding LacI/PurR family transcriptional regulator